MKTYIDEIQDKIDAVVKQHDLTRLKVKPRRKIGETTVYPLPLFLALSFLPKTVCCQILVTNVGIRKYYAALKVSKSFDFRGQK